MGKETFQIYLRSADAITGASTPDRCEFDLSQIIPNIETDTCRVRVSYLDIGVNSATFKAASVSTILVKLASKYTKDSFETNSQGGLSNSSLVGVISTGNSDHLSNEAAANLQHVLVGGLFTGQTTVLLQTQSGGSLASVLNTSAEGWSMVLDVEVEQNSCGCHE